MGGKKKPTISQLEKRAKKEQEKAQKQEAPRSKPKITLTSEGHLTRASIDSIHAEIVKLPYVTPYVLHSEYGLKISEAKRVLRALEERGLLRLVDANRRVRIYVPVAA